MLKALMVLLIFIPGGHIEGQIEAELLGRWADSTLVGSLAYNNTYNEVWGLVNDGREYAVIGSTFGTHFIDVTDPKNPVEVFKLKGGTSGPEIIHRDYHDFRGYLFAVADEGAKSTLQIVDYSFLPDSVKVVYDSKSLIRRAHNIFIDSLHAIMYACITAGDSLPHTPLRLFDISDPVDPAAMASYNNFDGFVVSQVHDAYVRDNLAFLNCGPGGFAIVDFTDPLDPVTLAGLRTSEYVQSGYNHSGWLSEDGRTYYMADETHGRDMKVFDVTDLPDVRLIDTIDAGSDSPISIPHNQIVHNNLLYVSYYYDGLQVYDIRDPENISRVAYYPTSQIMTRLTYEGAWGVYPFLPSNHVLVSDMQEGLFVIGLPVDLVSTNEAVLPSDWFVYPHPANDFFQIKNIHPKQNYEIRILDSGGRLLKHFNQQPFYNPGQPPGIYFILLTCEGQTSIKPLIIAH